MKLTAIDTLTIIEDAVYYEVTVSAGALRIASGASSGPVSLTAYSWKRIGESEREAYAAYYAMYVRTGSSFSRLTYGNNGTTWNVTNAEVASTADEIVIVTSDTALSAPAYGTALPSVFLAKVSIPISKDGNAGGQGSTGKTCYIVGDYRSDVTYLSNENETVAVEVPQNDGTSQLWELVATTNVVNGVHYAPGDNAGIWRQGLNTYNLIRTKYLFADFARLGTAVVSGDWEYSATGTINGQFYDDGDLFHGKPAYTQFNPLHPLDVETVEFSRNTELQLSSSTAANTSLLVYLEAGKVYLFKMKTRYGNANLDPNYRMLEFAFVYNGQSDYGYYDVSSGSYPANPASWWFVAKYTGYHTIKLSHKTGGAYHYINDMSVTRYNFIPQYAVDYRTGKTYQLDAYIRGIIRGAKFEYNVYKGSAANDSNGVVKTDADYVILSTGTWILPYAGNCLKQKITLVNPTKRTNASDIQLYARDSSGSNYASFILFDGDSEQTAGTGYPIGHDRRIVLWADPSVNKWRVLEHDNYS